MQDGKHGTWSRLGTSHSIRVSAGRLDPQWRPATGEPDFSASVPKCYWTVAAHYQAICPPSTNVCKASHAMRLVSRILGNVDCIARCCEPQRSASTWTYEHTAPMRPTPGPSVIHSTNREKFVSRGCIRPVTCLTNWAPLDLLQDLCESAIWQNNTVAATSFRLHVCVRGCHS